MTEPQGLPPLPPHFFRPPPWMPRPRPPEGIPRQEGISRQEERLPPEMLLITLLDDLNRRVAELKETFDAGIRYLRPPVTYQTLLDAVEITEPYPVVEISGIGSLDELVLATDSPDYSVVYRWDGFPSVRQTWQELAKYSTEYLQVAAYRQYDDQGNPGDYVLRFSNINFHRGITVIVEPANRLQIRKAIVRYSLRSK